MVVFVGAVPEWEEKNHFCTEVVQKKMVIRKIIRIRYGLALERIPSQNQIFVRQKMMWYAAHPRFANRR